MILVCLFCTFIIILLYFTLHLRLSSKIRLRAARGRGPWVREHVKEGHLTPDLYDWTESTFYFFCTVFPTLQWSFSSIFSDTVDRTTVRKKERERPRRPKHCDSFVQGHNTQQDTSMGTPFLHSHRRSVFDDFLWVRFPNFYDLGLPSVYSFNPSPKRGSFGTLMKSCPTVEHFLGLGIRNWFDMGLRTGVFVCIIYHNKFVKSKLSKKKWNGIIDYTFNFSIP